LLVYEQEDKAREPTARDAKLVVDPRQPESDTFQRRVTLEMVELDRESYRWYDDPLTNQHYIVFDSRRPQSKARAVYMEIERKAGGGVLDTFAIGNIQTGQNDSLLLMSIHAPSSEYDPTHPTWNLMWRNIYRIPKGVSASDLDLKVFKGLPGREGTSESLDYQLDDNNQAEGYYLEILGLDQFNLSQQKQPDNILDEGQEVFRGDDWGLLVFPHRTPFDSDTTFIDQSSRETAPLRTDVPTLYNYISQSEKVKNSEYYLQYVTRQRSNIVRLNRVNIIENSEVIIVNGNRLQRGTDYTIDYNFGQVTLLVDDANDPNADISIDYEYAPFLAVQKKTLLGLRAEYEWSRDLRIGSTLLYKSDKTQDRKPRVGQETAKMMVIDFDMDFRLYPNFLTKAVNALPMIETETKSTVSVSAEVAQSRPNPNVEDIAYVDDFESALDRVSLGVNRTNWSLSSVPDPVSDESVWKRGKLLWHRPYVLPRREEVFTINSDNVPQGEGVVQTLRMVFRHGHTEGNEPDSSWAGVMRPFEGRIDADRAQELKIRMRRLRKEVPGYLHLDFGVIDEDVDNDGASFGEDDRPLGDENRVVNEEEDRGLDGLFDAEEPDYDAATNPDPNDDNWYFLNRGDCPLGGANCGDAVVQSRFERPDDELYYEWLNGTQGNRVDAAQAARPDQERLTGTFTDRNSSSYFSFVIDLSDTTRSARFLDTASFSRNGEWVTYTIPIRDPDNYETFGTVEPRWNQVQHVRVWFEAIDPVWDPQDTLDLVVRQLPVVQDTLEIAEWYVVQSAWDDTVYVNDSLIRGVDEDPKLVVSSVTEEDGTFFAPPGVEPYRDPQQNVEETQRGLSLRYEDLRYGDTAFASRQLITAEAYSGYRTIEMYVYGDPSIAAGGDSTVQFIFRMGRDESNFYEFRTDAGLYPGWDERNYVVIDFNEITALKDAAIRNLETGQRVDTADGPYRVAGSPNVNQIKFFAFGLTQTDSIADSAVTGELWVDELRVTGVRRDIGTAGRVSLTGNMADLLNYSVSYQYKDPYFRGISTATRGGSSNNLGSGQTEKNLAWTASINLDKFAPRSWGARLPLSFGYNQTTRLPLLKNNSDIVLPEESRELEKSTASSRSFSISESFNRKGKNPLFSVLLNRQTVRFSYSRSNQRSVNRPFYLGENYSIRASYEAGIARPPKLPIFFWAKRIPLLKGVVGREVILYPSTWKFSGQLSRTLSISEDSDRKRISSLKRDFGGDMNMNYQIMENLGTSFRYTTKRDLTDPDLVNITLNPNNFKLGLETNFSQAFTSNYDPKLLNFFTHKFSFSATYRDSYERSTETLRSDLNQTWNVAGRFDHQQLLSIGSEQPGRRSGDRTVKRPFFDPPLAVVRFLTSWINPVGYKYAKSYSNSVPGMQTRPSLAYRFGLRREADVDTVTIGRSRYARETEAYDLSSGFGFLGGLNTDVRYSRAISSDVVRLGTRTESITTKWPDLTIRISQFRNIPFIKGVLNKFISVFAPRTGFSRDVREDRDLDASFTVSESVTLNYSPLLSVNFRLLRNFSVSGSYTLNKTEVKKFNRVSGDLDNESRSNKKSIGFSSRFSFTAPGGIGIPLFGKVKFRSTVTIDLNVRYSSNKTENSDRGLPFRVTTEKSDLTVSPVISYAFSDQIKGGLTARWQDSNDAKFDRKSHVRELQIWTEIRF
jgi:cell surface protein SprA